MKVSLEFAEDLDLVCQFFELAPDEVKTFKNAIKGDFEAVAPSVHRDARAIRAIRAQWGAMPAPEALPGEYKHLSPFLAASLVVLPPDVIPF